MNFLNKVTSGKQVGAQIHVMTGDNGVGKSTWAGSFPSVLFADLESGSKHLDVKRLTPENIPDLISVRNLIKELISENHDYKTFVIDSIESLESLISDFVCREGKVDSIEKYDGGWGKGYTRCREVMREIMVDLGLLRDKGVTTILIGHTQTKSKTDPATNQTWDRVIMRCNDKMASVIRDLADNVFYATYKVFTANDKGKTKAFGDGSRIMYTQYRPGFDSKNRLDLPFELPLSYSAFKEACELKPEANAETLISEIKQIAEVVDADLKKKVDDQLEKFKTNPTKLQEIKNRLMTYTNK